MPEKEDLNIIMRASDILKKSDFEDSFKKVLDLLIKSQKQQGQAIENLERTYNALIDRIKKEHEVSLGDLKIKTNQLFVGDRLKEMGSNIRKNFDDLKGTIDAMVNKKLKDVDFKISQVKSGERGPQGERGLPGSADFPEMIRTKLELLKGDDRLDAQFIKGLDKLGGSIGPSVITSRALNNITPSGTVNGANAAFTLEKAPRKNGERVYLNGVRMRSGSDNDYTISNKTITFNTAPLTGDVILVDIDY